MKKIFALLLVLVLLVSFAACNSQKVMMQELVEANKSEKVLETHDSIYVHSFIGGQTYADYYLTKTYSYEKQDTWALYMTSDTAYSYSNGAYQRVVFLTRNGLVDYTDYRADQYAELTLSQDSLREKIRSVTETEDQITVSSVMSKRNLKKVLGQEGADSFEATYVVDAETYNLINAWGTFTLEDGTMVDFSTDCTYNGEMPEEIAPFQEYENQTENLRTVTLVFHAGTEKETAEQILAPKGLAISLALPKGSTAEDGFHVYADAACTVLHQSNGDYESDITVYIK